MYAKKVGGTFCSLLLNEKQKKPFVYSNNEISEASRSCLFLHTFSLESEAQTSAKKITGLGFSKKLETTCKSSAHLDKKN